MILVVSTCKWKLSEEEFVRPITDIVKSLGLKYEVKKYSEEINFERFSKIIICGTALKDFDYMNYIDNFIPIREFPGCVLGICAGYQIIARIFGNELSKIKMIGVYDIKINKKSKISDTGTTKSYFLHNFTLSKTNEQLEPLALCKNTVCMFKVRKKEFYGTSFHPEVLNPEIIVNFLKM